MLCIDSTAAVEPFRLAYSPPSRPRAGSLRGAVAALLLGRQVWTDRECRIADKLVANDWRHEALDPERADALAGMVMEYEKQREAIKDRGCKLAETVRDSPHGVHVRALRVSAKIRAALTEARELAYTKARKPRKSRQGQAAMARIPVLEARAERVSEFWHRRAKMRGDIKGWL